MKNNKIVLMASSSGEEYLLDLSDYDMFDRDDHLKTILKYLASRDSLKMREIAEDLINMGYKIEFKRTEYVG